MNAYDKPTRGVNRGRKAVIALAGLLTFALPTAGSFAHTPGGEANSEAEAQLSAHDARRLARVHLCSAGYCGSFGPGAAKVSSITRDAETWVLHVRLSDSGTAFKQHHVLYIDANTGVVSEVPPETSPTQVASE